MPDVSREYLRDRIIAVWRNFKSDLHTKYVKGKNPMVVKAGVAPEFVNIDDWSTFEDYCNSATFQALSEQNSANRKKLEAPACVDRNRMAVIRHNIEKIRQCERLDPKTKTTSVDDSIAKGPSCNSSQPTSVPSTLALISAKKGTLNGVIEARVACGKVVSIDHTVLIYGAVLGYGFYKILLSQIFSPTCRLIKPDGYVDTLGEVDVGGYVAWPKWSVSTEVSSDLTIEVGVKYLLHKPLISIFHIEDAKYLDMFSLSTVYEVVYIRSSFTTAERASGALRVIGVDLNPNMLKETKKIGVTE
ncbi:hypothetical protein GIB67_012341 [Kingdonia uniflora]|uniref:Transposase Tnp1/En/Spm-like domain-containing protein n=1 Tax=Kingdonia uniflora TaxID=39325 RepID=A0A7J7MVQ7_9MAGN|nr:hypothetical protein GIB67_012341 [Kingdonia uniflora]